MNKKKNYLYIILIILGLVIFSLMVGLLLSNNVGWYDNLIYSFIIKMKSDIATIIFLFISLCCSTYFLIISIIVILLVCKDKKKAFYICLNIGICVLINQVFKYIFARSRPVGINIVTENGFSFPSGHSMAGLAYYGMYIYLLVSSNMEKVYKVIGSIIIGLLILLIGISRIYLGVHFASDVTAGFGLSLAYLVIYIKFVYKKRMTC